MCSAAVIFQYPFTIINFHLFLPCIFSLCFGKISCLNSLVITISPFSPFTSFWDSYYSNYEPLGIIVSIDWLIDWLSSNLLFIICLAYFPRDFFNFQTFCWDFLQNYLIFNCQELIYVWQLFFIAKFSCFMHIVAWSITLRLLMDTFEDSFTPSLASFLMVFFFFHSIFHLRYKYPINMYWSIAVCSY